MATKKAATSTKTKATTASRARSAKTAPTKRSNVATKVTRVSAKAAPSRNVASGTGTTVAGRLDSNTLNIVLAEAIGTFILVLVALLAWQNVMPLYLGLTFILLVMTIGAVSGSHVNPAVTFGLWAAGRLKAALLPFYWAAQLLGAMGAFVLLNAFTGGSMGLDFGNFWRLDWGIFGVELVATAVFLLGVTAVVMRADLTATGKAVGFGLSLMAGLLVGGSLYTPLAQTAQDDYVAELNRMYADAPQNDDGADLSGLRDLDVPRASLVGGVTLNPAIALATTEDQTVESIHAQTGITEQMPGNDQRPAGSNNTRLGLETILGTLLGAALGANLARLINHRFNV